MERVNNFSQCDNKKQVVTITDIDEVIRIMGQPQEFESGEYHQEEEQKALPRNSK